MGRNAIRYSLLAVGIFATGCQGEDVARYQADEDHFSIRALDGWSAKREKGTVVFRHDAEGSRATIAIRAVRYETPERESRTRQTFLRSTEKVLRSYPEARVRGPKPVEKDEDRMAFEVSFVPTEKNRRYERRHVVVFERDHVFQLWHTAPAGELDETADAFAQVIDSFREEV